MLIQNSKNNFLVIPIFIILRIMVIKDNFKILKIMYLPNIGSNLYYTRTIFIHFKIQ